MSQRELGELLSLNGNTIGKVEAGTRVPRLQLVLAAEIALGQPTRQLFPALYEAIEQDGLSSSEGVLQQPCVRLVLLAPNYLNMTIYGEFGAEADNYAVARRGYPPVLIDNFKAALQRDRPIVLDVGCGTGIATRQLAEAGILVIGLDRDHRMLSSATNAVAYDVAYARGSAEIIPYSDETFDAVVSFGAFHWFRSEIAIAEIKRILCPNGIIYIVNKYDTDRTKEQFRALLEEVLGHNLPDPKHKYFPLEELQRRGIEILDIRSVPAMEKYSEAEAMRYFCSTGAWAAVPLSKQREVSSKLRELVKSHLVEGVLTRSIRVKAILARLPASLL